MDNAKKEAHIQIVKYLGKEISSGIYDSDALEALEVAKQCLENAFQVTEENLSEVPDVDFIKLLYEAKPKKVVTEADRKEAENLKNQGNMCLSENLIEDAIECYTRAIKLIDNNAVYYSNRAAAFTTLGDYDKALSDCKIAINIDPNYSKAYGRMGLVYSNKGDFLEAVRCYKRALEIDPSNPSYQQNLSVAQSRLVACGANPAAAAAAPSFSIPGMPPGVDINAVLQNPAWMNMATQLMSDPNMRTQIGQMMSNFFGAPGGASDGGAPPPAAAATTTPTATPNSNVNASEGGAGVGAAVGPGAPMDAMLRIGEVLAEQLRSANPVLVEQLREQYQHNNADGENSNSEGGARGPNPNDGSSG